MARLSRLGFLTIAVIFHLIYAWSIFDIYFVSPIVRGMREYGVENVEAPAKRLVLYVGMYEPLDTSMRSFESDNVKVTDCARTRPFNRFLILHPRILLLWKKRKSLALLCRSFALRFSVKVHSAYHIRGYPPSHDQVMLPSLQDCMRMSLQS